MRKSDVRSIWLKQGLALAPFALFRSRVSQDYSLSEEARLRLALEETGGVFAAYGSYLSGRPDVLPVSALSELSRIRTPSLMSVVLEDFPEIVRGIQNPEPVGHSVFSRAYRASRDGREVTIEIFADGVREIGSRQWDDFRAGLSCLVGSPLDALCGEDLLADFRQWLNLQADIQRKRRILENLQQLPDGCVTRVPRLVRGLEDDRVLVYERLPGTTLDEILHTGGDRCARVVQLCCELSLEWGLFLGVVPSELDPQLLVVTEDEGVGPLVWPALETVPAELTFELLQYVTSGLSGDQSRAVHMLGRMSTDHLGGFQEEAVWDQLSAQHAQLEVKATLPESAAALNDLWMALKGAGFGAPSFLTLFHRQLHFWGRLNTRFTPETDLLSESIWPVLGRVFRFQMAQSLSVQRTKEWVVGSGLAFLGAVRQFGITLEQLRSNDLTVSVQVEEAGTSSDGGRGNALLLVAGVLTLAVFMISLQMAFWTPGAAGLLATAVAALSGIGLVFNLARLD